MRDGRINGTANDGRERGGLGKGQLRDRLAEIVFGRRFEAVVAGAEVNLIAVHRENLVFGVVALDFDGENRLLHFAVEAAVGAIEEEAAGELHREGAGAFLDLMMADVVPGGLEHAREIDAPMFLEVLILGGEDGFLQSLGNLARGEEDAALQGERADRLPVVGIQLRDNVGAIVFERANFRQIAAIDEEQTYRGTHRNRAEDEKGERQTSEQRPVSNFYDGAIILHGLVILAHPRKRRRGARARVYKEFC